MSDPVVAPRLAVVCDDVSFHARAADLAARLNLPLTTSDDVSAYDFHLAYTLPAAASSRDEAVSEVPGPPTPQLEIRALHHRPRLAPLLIDFTTGPFAHRRRQHLRGELLAKAIGFKGTPMKVLDCTAGLGRDCAILALLENHVTACEQHPIVHALLADALDRAAHSTDPTLAPLRDNLTLVNASAVDVLATTCNFDVVYLDPMFPPRTKSALVKKEMRILASLVPHDEAADRALLRAAIASGVHRIVVKRPPAAPPLDPTLTYTHFNSPGVRYDVFFNTKPPRAPLTPSAL